MTRWRTYSRPCFDWWNWLTWNKCKYDHRYFSFKTQIYSNKKK